MNRYQSIGLSLLPERLQQIDTRAKELGLTRSKYIQLLVDVDIDGELLDCTIEAEGSKRVVKVREGVNLLVLDKTTVESLSVDLIVNTLRTLARTVPELVMGSLTGPVRKIASQVVKQRQ